MTVLVVAEVVEPSHTWRNLDSDKVRCNSPVIGLRPLCRFIDQLASECLRCMALIGGSPTASVRRDIAVTSFDVNAAGESTFGTKIAKQHSAPAMTFTRGETKL